MCYSPSGNRTPVSRVTGGDTHHYTNEELIVQKWVWPSFNLTTTKRRPVCFRTMEEKKRDCSANRQDYCLFLLFVSVGSQYGFTRHNGTHNTHTHTHTHTFSCRIALSNTNAQRTVSRQQFNSFNFMSRLFMDLLRIDHSDI